MNKTLIKQFLRFASVGTIGFVVDAGLVEVLQGVLGLACAQLAAFPVAASTTWVLNRQFTFGKSSFPLHQEWLRYIGSNLLGGGVNNGVYLWSVAQLSVASRHPVLAVAAGSIAGMLFNFAASRHIAFRTRKQTPSPDIVP